MLSSGLPPVLLVLSVLELSWCLSDEEKKIIVDEHNKYRSQVSPPAQAMMKMTWDKELEALAQSYAEKCIWDHNKERGRRGENLFAMAPTLELEFAVEDWNGEEKFYNFTTSTCVPGQMCGHYTQVVWSSTHQIGCGAHFCEKIDGIETENMHLLNQHQHPPQPNQHLQLQFTPQQNLNPHQCPLQPNLSPQNQCLPQPSQNPQPHSQPQPSPSPQHRHPSAQPSQNLPAQSQQQPQPGQNPPQQPWPSQNPPCQQPPALQPSQNPPQLWPGQHPPHQNPA
uniref:SCP domain-containing protein n=1 Tax=Junco hyemalis TaxID=40217 RepID=A0A8C5JPN6_JUNHY